MGSSRGYPGSFEGQQRVSMEAEPEHVLVQHWKEFPKNPIINASTMSEFGQEDAPRADLMFTELYKYNPWKAPGFAPVADPCGIVGGFNFSNPEDFDAHVNDIAAPEGLQYKAGTFGSSIFSKFLQSNDAVADESNSQPVTKWVAGQSAEVSFGNFVANHGGGYQYRLCPAAEFTEDGVENEECFQRMPLSYASDQSWIQWGADKSHRTAFKAIRVDDTNTGGVQPEGSTWTKLPLPNCYNTDCRDARLQFDPVAPGVFGQGTGMWYPAGKGERPGYSQYASKEQSQQELYDRMQKHYDFSVVDKVAVPANAKPGRYVLSWRWDAEQSPQVWGNCAVVEIQNMKPGKQQKLRGSYV